MTHFIRAVSGCVATLCKQFNKGVYDATQRIDCSRPFLAFPGESSIYSNRVYSKSLDTYPLKSEVELNGENNISLKVYLLVKYDPSNYCLSVA